MTSKNNKTEHAAPSSNSGQALRRRAEKVTREKVDRPPENQEAMSPEDTRKKLHELCVHEIELEMQNEELHRTQDELENSRDRYRRITEGLTDYQYTVRVENGCAVETKQSPTCAAVTGYTPEEFAADPYLWINMVVPEDRELVRERVNQILAGKNILTIEHRIIRKDGKFRWVSDTIILFRDTSGRLLSYDGVIKDITERKQAEEKLLQKNDELERFAYTVSHDLKSPLITIQYFTGQIMQDLQAGRHDNALDDLGKITSAVAKMTDLLNDLLELSRIGRIMNFSTEIDMGRLVEESLAQLAGPISRREVRMVVQPALPGVHGDPQRIAEVVQNLVENAVKYMGNQAAPRIEIGAREDAKETVFFVGDNGAGIDPRYHETIFGLFSKLDSRSEGTGVGLALAKRIVEAHGGRIWVESEGEGKGSTFCFTLPG